MIIEVSFIKEYSKILTAMYDDGWEILDNIAYGEHERLSEQILEYLRP